MECPCLHSLGCELDEEIFQEQIASSSLVQFQECIIETDAVPFLGRIFICLGANKQNARKALRHARNHRADHMRYGKIFQKGDRPNSYIKRKVRYYRTSGVYHKALQA